MGQVISNIINLVDDESEKRRSIEEHTKKVDDESEKRRSIEEHTKKLQAIISSNLVRIERERAPSPTVPEKLFNRVLQEEIRWIKHYNSSHKILFVGEGDFSFSACLAKVFGSAKNMVATSLDTIGFLMRNYRNSMANINELKTRGCMVIHGLDATQMKDYYLLSNMSFDRIIFNFPLAGFFKEESRQLQLQRNQNLVRLFMENAKKMISLNGEIHITHKSKGFFLEWRLEALATLCGLRLIEEVGFRLSDYPGYNNKYGFGGDNNFDCNPSKTYKFGLQYWGFV